MKRRHELAVSDAQGGLDQPQHARRGIEMSDVGLDRSDTTRSVGWPGRHDDAEGLGLHRVTLRRPRSMKLHIVHRLRVDVRHRACREDCVALGLATRLDDPVPAPIVVRGRPQDERVNAVATRERRRQRLDEHEACAFAPYEAVGLGVPCPYSSGRRQRRSLAHRDIHVGGEDQAHATREGPVRLSSGHAPASLVEGDKRSAAIRIDREAWAAKIEVEGDPVGRIRERIVLRSVPIDRAQVSAVEPAVVVEHDPNEDPGPTPGRLGNGQAGVFESFPGNLEQ